MSKHFDEDKLKAALEEGMRACIGGSMRRSIFSTSNKWAEFERRKRALPPMSPQEYERAVREICRELGI